MVFYELECILKILLLFNKSYNLEPQQLDIDISDSDYVF